MKIKVLLFMAVLCPQVMNAQNVQFVGGFNYSNIQFSKPVSANTNFVERYSSFAGYQAGIKVELGRDEDTDELGLFSLSLEALVAQHGTNYYAYNGNSSQVWVDKDANPIKSEGTIVTKLEIANTYLKLPISISVNINEHFSVQLGGYAAYMIQSKGTGTVTYSGTVSKKHLPLSKSNDDLLDTFRIKSFQTKLIGDYLEASDMAIVRSGDSLLCAANPSLGMRPIELGGYYDRNGRDGLLFNRLDLGLHAGIKLEAGGWFIATRVSYGMSDVFNNGYHRTPVLDENKKFVLNNDFQRNISYELNIGYSF
jgi:hypothetical protein